jgi:hypothetical protein
LATVAFKLICDVGAYVEVLHPYDWYEKQKCFDKTFMKPGLECPRLRTSNRGLSNIEGSDNERKKPVKRKTAKGFAPY